MKSNEQYNSLGGQARRVLHAEAEVADGKLGLAWESN